MLKTIRYEKLATTEMVRLGRRVFLTQICKATAIIAGMSVLAPYKAHAAHAASPGYDPATIAKEHPTCRHFWPCDALVSGKIIDYIGGANLRPTYNSFQQGSGYIDPSVNGNTGNIIVDAPFSTVGTKVFFTMVVLAQRGSLGVGIHCHPPVSSPNIGEFELWQDNNVSTSYVGVNGNYVMDDTVTAVSPEPVAIGMVFKPGKTARFFYINATGLVTESNKDNDPNIATLKYIPPFHQGLAFFGNKNNGISRLFGMIQCHFNEVPYDWEAAAKWMFSEWVAGNKQIYPGWRAA